MNDIRQFSDQGAKSSRRITKLESLCKQHEEAIKKLKQESTTLELGIQSCNELILDIVTETRLDRMGENDNEGDSEDEDDDDDDDDDGGDATTAPGVAPPADTTPAAAAAPKLVAEEEEDPEMLILE
jgi:hypothetical protein